MTAERNLSKRVRIPLINLSSHGGVRILVELANAFVRDGWTVEILIPPGRNSSVYRLEPAVLVRQVGIATGIKFFDYTFFLLLLPLRLRGGLTVANFFVTYFPCLLGSFLGRSRHLYFVQDIESKYTGFVGRILNAVCEVSYYSRRMVAANNYLKEKLEARGHQVYKVIRIGPTEPFFIEPQAQGDRTYDLMYMPRHEAWKRIDRFQEVCAMLPEISPSQILCVGQSKEILEQLARQGFATCRPKDDLELVRCFDCTKVFLLTSDKEGFGLPPLEAMARGVPVVSFRCGGPDLYIKDGKNSYLVNNAEEAVQRIRTLLTRSVEWERMAEESRETAQNFRLFKGLEEFLACAEEEL